MSAYLWPLSRTTVIDLNGDVAPGAKLNFWTAGTTTPLVVYQDSALTVPHANIIEADAAGRWPAVYMTYTDYRQRVRTSAGTLLFDDDGIANPAPAETGGGGSVPDAELVKTGFIKFELGEGALSGFVRLNARSIGNAGSGATERANADTEDLYAYLYDRLPDTVCPVSGGRGANAAADFAANKALTLPDWRGITPAGLADMGNSTSTRLDGVTFAVGDSTTPGSSGGAATVTLTVDQMPSHGHPGSAANPGGAHSHQYFRNSTSFVGGTPVTNGPNLEAADTTSTAADHTHTLNITAQGGSQAHNNMQPFALVTFYIKL